MAVVPRCSYCGKIHVVGQLWKCTACAAVMCVFSLVIGEDEHEIEICTHERYDDSPGIKNSPTLRCGPCFQFDPDDPEVFESYKKLAAGKRKLAILEAVEETEKEIGDRERMLEKIRDSAPSRPAQPLPRSDDFTKPWRQVGEPEPGGKWTGDPPKQSDNYTESVEEAIEEKFATKMKKVFPEPMVPEDVQERWMKIVRKAGLIDD